MGISVFQSDNEVKMICQDKVHLEQRWDKHIEKIKNTTTLDDDREEELKVPVPSAKHTYCGVCCRNYTDYISHINSAEHSAYVKSNSLFLEIDDFID